MKPNQLSGIEFKTLLFKFIFLVLVFITCFSINPVTGQTCAGNFQVVGDATIEPVTQKLILTPAMNNKLGAGWAASKANLNMPFDFTATIFAGSSNAGADGLTFVIHNDPRGMTAIGQCCGALGAGKWNGLAGITPSLIIELDTWQNLESYDGGWNDIADDHIAAYINADGTHQVNANRKIAPVSLGNIEDNTDHTLRVTWNPGTQLIEIYFDNVMRGSTNFDLITYLGTSLAYWGYTAGTGGAYNLQTVCPQSAPPSACAGNFVTVGNTTVDPSTQELIITPAAQFQLGAGWSPNKANLALPFDFSADIYAGDNDVNGADGMTFVLHNDTRGLSAIGTSGGGLGAGGFGGNPGITPSLIIEFDTYQNGTPYSDPAADHIAAQINADCTHQNNSNRIIAPVTLPNIENNAYHSVRVTWNPTSQLIEIYFDGVKKGEANIDLITYFGTSLVYWGYTAATGGSFNRQTACPQNTPNSSYTVTYDANGGTGNVPVDPNGYSPGATVAVLGNTGVPPLTKVGYYFGGWNTAANGSGTTYQAGNNFTINNNVILYAKWELCNYTTVAPGNFDDPATWPPLCFPPNPLPDGMSVTILHEVINPAGKTWTNNGVITIGAGGKFTNYGTYQGNGTFNGNFKNEGIVKPANQP